MQRPPPSSIPDAPGSYQFRDARGEVIYVGKAKSLRNRLASYFGDAHTLGPRTRQMMVEAASVEWIQVATEPEAVMLEFSLIKEHRPRYNIQLRDDKSYPYLAITVGDEWPRPMLIRGSRKKGVRYFGPYANAASLRETLDLLVKSMPLRTCSDAKLERHRNLGKPCLLYHIQRCAGPCIGAVAGEEYAALVSGMCSFLEGDTEEVISGMRAEMEEASGALEYERAARLRDRIEAAATAGERQQVVTVSSKSFDVMGIAIDSIDASVQLFRVRHGRVVGRRGFLLDRIGATSGTDLAVSSAAQASEAEWPGTVVTESKAITLPEEGSMSALVAVALSTAYDDATGTVPREVLVPAMPPDAGLYTGWLSDLRGRPVSLRVPQRGVARDLQAMVTTNAKDELVRVRLHRGLDARSRTDALEGLRAALGLLSAPLRIECYDMSHIQGTDYVGSMVVLEDGLPKRKDYRHFRIRSVAGNDDYAAMREVLERRFSRLVEGVDEAGAFAHAPDLLLVDGGRGQLNVAVGVLDALGLGARIPAAALAKRYEEVFLPSCDGPVALPGGSEELHLLQRVRDEAHRFAVSYHRRLRGKRMVQSALGAIEGLGPVRLQRLLDELGGTAGVMDASREALASLPWLPDRVADAVYTKLHA